MIKHDASPKDASSKDAPSSEDAEEIHLMRVYATEVFQQDAAALKRREFDNPEIRIDYSLCIGEVMATSVAHSRNLLVGAYGGTGIRFRDIHIVKSDMATESQLMVSMGYIGYNLYTLYTIGGVCVFKFSFGLNGDRTIGVVDSMVNKTNLTDNAFIYTCCKIASRIFAQIDLFDIFRRWADTTKGLWETGYKITATTKEGKSTSRVEPLDSIDVFER